MDVSAPRFTARSLLPLLALLALLSLVACESPSMVQESVDDDAHSSIHTHPPAAHAEGVASSLDLRRLRALLLLKVKVVTSRFHSTRQAERAGYAEASPCVAAPGLGGMGFHWVNQELVDPVFDPLRPEAVLYAPTRGGGLALVAVEYIVLDVGQPAPTFAGQPFDVGGAPLPVPHWTLHVWLHRANPSGIFAPFNPRVSCS